MRHSFLLSLIACVALSSTTVRAQVPRTSTGDLSHLWVGAEYSNFYPDWGIPRLPGLGFYANINLYKRLGAEGEARFFTFTKPGGLTEKNFFFGPNVLVYQHGRFYGNVRFVAGAGLVTYTNGIGYGSYFAFAPGGNVEYRFARNWKARFDYEHQFLPSAPGLPGYPDNGLTPAGYSGGISYRIY